MEKARMNDLLKIPQILIDAANTPNKKLSKEL